MLISLLPIITVTEYKIILALRNLFTVLVIFLVYFLNFKVIYSYMNLYHASNSNYTQS